MLDLIKITEFSIPQLHQIYAIKSILYGAIKIPIFNGILRWKCLFLGEKKVKGANSNVRPFIFLHIYTLALSIGYLPMLSSD